MAHKLKTPSEMEKEREKQAVVDAALRAKHKPEANVATPLARFEVGRYTSGSFKGMFVVSQTVEEIVYKDKDGEKLDKPTKKSVRKIVADGVDLFVAITSLETALRKRVFR
jgi:hypothetical protein